MIKRKKNISKKEKDWKEKEYEKVFLEKSKSDQRKRIYALNQLMTILEKERLKNDISNRSNSV